MTHPAWGILAITALGAVPDARSGTGLDAVQAISRSADAPGSAPLIRDVDLDAAASKHAVELLADESAANIDRVQAALADSGVADAQVVPFSALGGGAALDAALSAMIKRQIAGRGFSHYGLSRRGKGPEALVVLFVRRLIAVPRMPAVGHRPAMRVQGVMAEGTRQLRGFLTPPRGGVTSLVAKTSGRGFEVSVPFAKGPGRYDFELLVDTERGPEVALLWPFFVDTPPARHTWGAVTALPNTTTTLLALIRRARAAVGLPAPKPHAALTAAAQAHASAVCAAMLAAHVLPGGSTPTARARHQGFEGPLTENVAIAASVARAQENIMASPSHRRNVLDAAARRLGVGIASRGAGAQTSWCVVELYGLR